MITTEQIKELREKTGVSIMQCKKALEEAKGDIEKASILLQKKSAAIADKKSGRTLKAGAIQSYIHATGTVGVMIELLSESDFVSGSTEFKTLARDIAMHIAASSPEFIKKEDITPEAQKTVREVFEEEIKGKPEKMREKILQGKLDAYFGEKTLLDQKYIKNPEITVRGLIESAIQKFGEKIEIARFVRYSTGK